jgi:hypothetical protein
MEVIAHQIPESYGRKKGDDLSDIVLDSAKHEQWLSTTTVLYNPNDGYVYLGLTKINGDVFYRFDRETGESECLDYLSVRADREVKIHRSLDIAPDGRIFGACAGLITIKERETAPGGQLWSWNPKTKEYDVYGTPSPGDYVQHITVDHERNLAYGCTYPVPWFFVYDLKARKTIRHTFIGGYPHKTAIDDNGVAWSGYNPTGDPNTGEGYIFCYNPDTDKMVWTDLQLPAVGRSDDKQIDDMVNLGDGYIYIGSVSGALSRLDPIKREVEWLGKPSRGMRLCGIDDGPDGRIYATSGAYYGMATADSMCQAHAFDRETMQFTTLGDIYDSNVGFGCAALHSLSVDDNGTLWVGETDSDKHSGCLWECRV